MDLATARPVTEHIYFESGCGAKTVCTSHVLAAFGIDASTYHYSGQLEQRLAVLRRNGWAARSRFSQLRKGTTMGQVRVAIRRISPTDPVGTRYMLRVVANGTGHALLLDGQGKTLVDTAPRELDRRRVTDLRAIFPLGADA
jgi:hypothetical protein